MENKIYKVAVVGCGSISANHLHGLKANNNVEVVALCDIIPERAEARAEEYSVNCKIYTDYYEMLDKEELDSVHICTPHYLHAPMTIAALKKDINVFLEKPACISTSEIEDMLKAEKESRGMVCVSFQNRLNPSTLLAKKLIEEDGGADCAYGIIFWHRNEGYYTNSGWRGKKATEGGGVMINQAIHTLDLLRYLCGMPKSVIANTDNISLRGDIEVEDTAYGRFMLESGKVFTIFATNSMNYSFPTTITIHADHDTMYIIGDGTVLINDKVIMKNHAKRREVGKRVWGAGHKGLISDFYRCIKTGDKFALDFYEAQLAVRMILAMYRSHGEEVEI